jgi:hypothetical protein
MKKDFSTQLTNIEGKPLQKPKAIPLNEWVDEMKEAVADGNLPNLTMLLDRMETLKETPNLTMKDVCVVALTELHQEDQKMTGVQKLELDALAHKINNSKDGIVEVEAKDITLILDRLNKSTYGSVAVYGQVHKLLNSDMDSKKK